LIGAGLAMAVALAHAQHLRAPSGGFPHVTVSRAIFAGGAGFGGMRAMNVGGGMRGYGMRVDGPARRARPFNRYDVAQRNVADAANFPGRRGDTWYSGGITPVSAETRPVPRPPSADSPLRAGSIREDVARYNEERAAFRPFARGSVDGTRSPMPSPYRN